jgi:hypothetical protein
MSLNVQSIDPPAYENDISGPITFVRQRHTAQRLHFSIHVTAYRLQSVLHFLPSFAFDLLHI